MSRPPFFSFSGLSADAELAAELISLPTALLAMVCDAIVKLKVRLGADVSRVTVPMATLIIITRGAHWHLRRTEVAVHPLQERPLLLQATPELSGPAMICDRRALVQSRRRCGRSDPGADASVGHWQPPSPRKAASAGRAGAPRGTRRTDSTLFCQSESLVFCQWS